MNKLQKAYAVAKAEYDVAMDVQDWNLVEELETPMLEAEAEMVEWALDHAEKSKLIPTDFLATLRDRWMFPQYHERMVDLAFRLAI